MKTKSNKNKSSLSLFFLNESRSFQKINCKFLNVKNICCLKVYLPLVRYFPEEVQRKCPLCHAAQMRDAADQFLA